MKASEFALIAHDTPHIYVCGDEPDSPYLQLKVVANGTLFSIDLLPQRLATVRDLINDCLESAGLCPHG